MASPLRGVEAGDTGGPQTGARPPLAWSRLLPRLPRADCLWVSPDPSHVCPGRQAEEERDASGLGTLPRVPPSTVCDVEATMPALAQLVVHHDPLAFSR